MKQIYTGIIVVLLLVVAVSWIGLGIYDALATSEVDPNAQTYTKQIKAEFDTAILDELEQRVEDLPVSPDVFHEIEDEVAAENGTSNTDTGDITE